MTEPYAVGIPAESSRRLRIPAALRSGPGLVVVATAMLWLVQLVDRAPGMDLGRNGIVPRTLSGLDGVLWAPLLHNGSGHLVANTLPFIVLGGLVVLLRGTRQWVTATLFIWVAGGAATWLLGRPATLHIGISIVIFGYVGLLIAVGLFERRPKGLLVAAFVVLTYGVSLFWGMLPIRDEISWEGHLFGLIAGIVAALMMADRPAATVPEARELGIDDSSPHRRAA